MNSALNILEYNLAIEYRQDIIQTLSSYIVKCINSDGSVSCKEVKTKYYLDNDTWNLEFFGNIEQFKKQYSEYTRCNKNIFFRFNNFHVNTEIKFIVYNNIFRNGTTLSSVFSNQNSMFKMLSEFINKIYPNLNSILDLDIEKASLEWVDWLNNKGIQTLRIRDEKILGKEYTHKTSLAYLINQIYRELFNLNDTREEWEKDIWDLRNLEKYGLAYNKSHANYVIDFSQIENENIKKSIRKYYKEKLLSDKNFTTGTAQHNICFIKKFINYILQLEPTWNNFRRLERKHIEKYIEWLNQYTKYSLTRKNSNPSHYKNRALTCVNKFLSDIQMREYEIASVKNIKVLIFPEDKPTLIKKAFDQINYVPDYVLDQLFKNINNLNSDVVPVVWIMYKTGLRISDVLGLKQDCLVKLNNSYWIETDIEKTYVQGHRIPIDSELANMLASLIDRTKANSNKDNNPEDIIFVKYSGRRKGKPYVTGWVRKTLNVFAIEYNIIDETGNIYHFKNHAFRHTYAMKLLNGGADILTVQELLAHASPEMTMRYAKLLDDTKRKAFDNAVKQGVFSFDIEGKLHKEADGEIPKNVLNMLWTNHKLNAIDTPYGTCLQRSKGKCTFAKQPQCLTCNGGRPCKDLGVGIFEGDIKKYEIHISSTKSLIEQAKAFNREYMANENEELLTLYEGIYNTVISGNIVYGRIERLMKQGDENEQL